MTNIELALNMLAEASTTELSQTKNPTTFPENASVAQEGGQVAKSARNELEKRFGRSVISSEGASQYLDTPDLSSPALPFEGEGTLEE